LNLETVMTPADILPDNINTIDSGGLLVRKGSVAAFLGKAFILDDAQASEATRAEAERDLRALLPAMRQLRIVDVFTLKSEIVHRIAHGA